MCVCIKFCAKNRPVGSIYPDDPGQPDRQTKYIRPATFIPEYNFSRKYQFHKNRIPKLILNFSYRLRFHLFSRISFMKAWYEWLARNMYYSDVLSNASTSTGLVRPTEIKKNGKWRRKWWRNLARTVCMALDKTGRRRGFFAKQWIPFAWSVCGLMWMPRKVFRCVSPFDQNC